MRRIPIKTGTQLIFLVLCIRDFFCVFLRYQIVINCIFSYFNWVITQIRSLIKVLLIYLIFFFFFPNPHFSKLSFSEISQEKYDKYMTLSSHSKSLKKYHKIFKIGLLIKKICLKIIMNRQFACYRGGNPETSKSKFLQICGIVSIIWRHGCRIKLYILLPNRNVCSMARLFMLVNKKVLFWCPNALQLLIILMLCCINRMA